MKNRSQKFTKAVSEAIQIIEKYGKGLELTISEMTNIILRIRMKNIALVAHISSDDEACNPMRVAYLGILDWRKEEARWYTPFRNQRRMNIQRKFADDWSRMDPRGTAARAITPVVTRGMSVHINN